jgi:hypothetical protein
MKIIVREGKGRIKSRIVTSVRFKCDECKCVFWADDDDYYYSYHSVGNESYCPKCKRLACEYGWFSRKKKTITTQLA